MKLSGPFGAGSVFGLKAPPLWASSGPAWRRKAPAFGQMLDAAWERVSARRHAFRQWEGMKMMIHEQVGATDPALQRVYSHFRRNLEDILTFAAPHRHEDNPLLDELEFERIVRRSLL